MASAAEVLSELYAISNPKNLAGMAYYGINTTNALGISIYDLRKIAKRIGVNHQLSLDMWDSGIHEGRILAAYLVDPNQLTEAQMDQWVADFNSWDICDQVCSNAFERTPFAREKNLEWIAREEIFIRRAGFVMIACLAVHNKEMNDEQFEEYFPLIAAYAFDERNFVKKAVNWALRQIGKRNLHLNQAAIRAAQEIALIESKSARWISSDALRELTNEKVQNRLK